MYKPQSDIAVQQQSYNKMMNNKIALVNKQLHNKLFQLQDDSQEEPQRIYRRHPLPPQMMLKNMIKKGLTHTQNNFLSRPKTATSNFTQTQQPKHSMRNLKSGFVSELRKNLSAKKTDIETESHTDFNINVDPPQQFQQFGNILKKIKWQREQQGVRKKVKLQKYGQRKFNFAWNKYNIPN